MTTMADEGFRMHSLPLEILDDLGSRFIINLPEEERKDLIRICFQIEIAHWFFIDEYVSDEAQADAFNSKLGSCSIREFAEHMFRHIGFLRVHANRVDQILNEWKEYKMAVPTNGAIILNEDLTKVLLVQGYRAKSSWGFPKGKINEDEAPHACAVREVFEETGYDISGKIDPDDYVSLEINDQTTQLYFIPGVPNDTPFAPRTKKEIGDIQWFDISSLPTSKFSDIQALGLSHNKLFMVTPFVREILNWVKRRKKDKLSRRQSRSSTNATPKPATTTTSASVPLAHEPKRDVQKGLMVIDESFVPRAWTNFRLKKKELLSAIESTPGWTQ